MEKRRKTLSNNQILFEPFLLAATPFCSEIIYLIANYATPILMPRKRVFSWCILEEHVHWISATHVCTSDYNTPSSVYLTDLKTGNKVAVFEDIRRSRPENSSDLRFNTYTINSKRCLVRAFQVEGYWNFSICTAPTISIDCREDTVFLMGFEKYMILSTGLKTDIWETEIC